MIKTRLRVSLATSAAVLLAVMLLSAQQPPTAWSEGEKPILERLRGLRGVPDDQRPDATRRLALDIRALPPSEQKLSLASSLANLATEGDPGAGTLQEVATTLAQALHESPPSIHNGEPAMGYSTLAQLVRYEHVTASLDDPQFAAATARLEAADKRRQSADFSLTDLKGKRWTLKDLHGQVVLVNFWATWCPPCRKEMPDLESLQARFGPRGLVILAISDEEQSKVEPFIAEHKITYPILLDPGRKVNELFQVEGIPKTFVYDRNGNLAAQAIDMRTGKQFLDMLARAGLE
jgi:peroxiredoxin